MKLRKISLIMTLMVSISLVLSLFALWQRYVAHQLVINAQENRHQTLMIVQYYKDQIFQLNRLVNDYIGTANPRYLIYYYDLLSIQEGKKPTPIEYTSSAYWPMVISGEIKHQIPTHGKATSILDIMKNAGFSREEFETLDEIFSILEDIKKIEQIAFAATQGLYDKEKKMFVDDGIPDKTYAFERIYSKEYRVLNALLNKSIEQLMQQTSLRTHSIVAQADQELKKWIAFSFICTLFVAIIVFISLFGVKRFLLDPIQFLTDATKTIAKGTYNFQIDSQKWLQELDLLARTFNTMARHILEDISNRQKIQVELEDAKQIAEDATKAKSIFLATMSHEIRTPMNAIIGMTYLALQSKLDKKQREYIDHVYAAANSLLRIINDILDYSKIEAGKMTIELIPFNLKELIEEIIKMHTYASKEKGIELVLDSNDVMLTADAPFVVGDKVRLGQILNNLLSNAIKFTKEGFVCLSLHSFISEAQVRLVFRIQDSGIGMSENQMAKLFQEFTQADDATTRKYGGTGLGLAISKNLAEQMGGSLRVESEYNQGSTFELLLNFETTASDQIAHNTVSYAKEMGKTLQGMRVLLVEDNSMNQTIVLELLHSKGIQVCVAQNGQEAVERIFEEDADYFDAVLMDIQMPIMNGYEATGRIRENQQYDSLPIIAMSGHVLPEELGTFKEKGMQGQITKPIDPQTLFNALLCHSKHVDISLEDEETDVPDMPYIQGLDTRLGFMYAAYNQKRYDAMLQEFVTEHEKTYSDIQQWLKSGDFESVNHAIIELRRVLGNIGAKALHVKVRNIKDDAQKGLFTPSVLKDFNTSFTELLGNVKTYLSKVETNFSGKEAQLALLEAFIEKVADNNFDAIEQWNDNKPLFTLLLGNDTVLKVSKMLSSFDFEAVLKILNEVSIAKKF